MKGKPKAAPLFLALALALAAAAAGAFELDSVAWRNLGAAQGFAGGSVSAMLQDRRGYVWIGASGGLYRFDGSSFIRVGPAQGSFASVTCLAEDRNGFIWAGSRGMGLGIYNPVEDSFQRFLGEEGRSSAGVRSLALDREGRMIVAWEGGGLSAIRGREEIALDLPKEEFGPLLADVSGRIWLGSGSGGLKVLGPDGGLVAEHRHDPRREDSLASDSIRVIFEDSLGYLWIGLGDGGVDLYREGSFAHGISGGPGRGAVISMAEDVKGRIWLGREQGGVEVLEPSSMMISGGSGFSGAKATAMLKDRRGLMWLGLERGGLVTGDHRSASVRRYRASVEGEDLGGAPGIVLSPRGQPVLRARSGKILEYIPELQGFAAAGEGSLSRLFSGPEHPKALGGRDLSSVVRGKDGRIWAGTRDSGLYVSDAKGQAFKRIGEETRRDSGLGSARIEAVFEDSKGRIWVGTGGAGLSALDPATGEVSFRGREAGIFADSAYGIQEDRAGRLWILSSSGLYCFDAERKDLFLMGEEDGLPGAGYDSGSILVARDGELWVSGEGGVASFNPDRITRFSSPPDVLISDVAPLGDARILSRSPDGTEITLPHDNAGLGFSIAVMDFFSFSRNRYALMLEGRQTAWTYTGNANKGYLAPLAPGKYMLRVKAANGNGVWNDYGASLSIIVKSPWWSSWWFESLAFGAAALSAATVVALGARSLRRRNALLAKFARHIEDAREEERKIAARDVHDEIGQYLMALNFNAYWLSSHLEASPGERKDKISEMRQTILGAMDSVKKIAQRLRPLSLEGNEFPDAIRVYVRNFEKMSGIKSEAEIGGGWHEMPSEYARIFFRILQEMVSNVARHSGAGRMAVDFHSDEEWYILSVRDDGKGMEGREVEAHDSFGFIGMREACSSEGGELAVRSAPGQGCEVSARLPRKAKGRKNHA